MNEELPLIEMRTQLRNVEIHFAVLGWSTAPNDGVVLGPGDQLVLSFDRPGDVGTFTVRRLTRPPAERRLPPARA